jgi:two-component system sensor histidine kinase PilS (NtrC family)
MLLVTLVVAEVFGAEPKIEVLVLCLGYALQSIVLWLLALLRRPAAPASRLRASQWMATIGVDIVCFTGLHVLAPVAGLNYVALLVLPALMAGVVTPRRIALATSAAITFVLLGVAWLNVLAGGDATVLMSQAASPAAVCSSSPCSRASWPGGLRARGADGTRQPERQQAQLNRL